MKNWVLPYVQQHRLLIFLTLALGLLGLGSGAMLLFVSGYLISKASLQPENIMLLYVPIVAVRAFSIGQAVFKYVERLVGHDVVLRILASMRSKLYRILEPQALNLRSRFRTGDLLGVLSDDLEHLQDLYIRTVFPSALALLLYTIIIVIIGAFDWMFALLLALMLGVIVFLVPFFSLIKNRSKHTRLKQRKNELYGALTDAVFGLSDWQASGRISEFLTRYTENENKLHKAELGLKRWNHMRDAALHVVVGIVVISMLVWAGNQVDSGQFSATIIAAFVLMTLSITDSLVPVSEAIESLPAYEDSLKRVSETEENSGQQNARNKNQLAGKENQTGIELEDVSFRYPNSENWVLQNVSLSISPGKKIAILGRSGTGKSTLLKLVTGELKPENGKIFINGMEADRSLLSDSISVLNQKPHLFDSTVGNNVRIGRPDAGDEEVWDALQSAQIAPLIASLPKGLDTPMHEMGKRFSGGERQRIAFARVLLQNTPIIILDEPTIGLDPATENALLETMFHAAKEKTIILVTHHLAQVEQVDEVIFLENGEIAMKSSHEQLLASSDKYKELYAMDRGI